MATILNTGSTFQGFSEFFFLKRTQSNGCEFPKIIGMAARKAFQNIVFHVSHPKILHSSLKTIWGSSYTNFRYLEYLDSFRKLALRIPNHGDGQTENIAQSFSMFYTQTSLAQA